MDSNRIKELSDKKEQLYKKWQEVEKQYLEAKMEDFNEYKGKYVKIENDVFMHINDLFTDERYGSSSFDLILNGKGFTYSISNYLDDCYFNCDMMLQQTIKLNKYSNDYKEQIEKVIQVIDKDTFEKEFKRGMSKFKKKWKEFE